EQLYDSLYGKLLTLPDHVVYPAHFGGAAWGKGLSGKPHSTIGFERRFNPALQFPSKEEFIDFGLADLPPQPEAFAENRRRNLAGS
ncbi:MAG: MBL fold metallo-hydrolase, partial [Candidatus Rokubacteria bacterium]|nr:MBL fold metallo-hydrolase [Candidatus Rokubacteria bacterium]